MSALDWLLDADPAIRWQAMRYLTNAPAHQVAAERARVATEGWGARLLAVRREDGLWDTGTPEPEWIWLLALLLLSILRTSSAGTVEPPDATDLSLERSRPRKSGCPIIAISIVGTPPDAVAFSDSHTSRTRPGSKEHKGPTLDNLPQSDA